MSKDLSDYYQKVGFYRANGLNEAQAYHRAEEVMETTFNVTILRRSAMTISFQTDSYNEAIKKSAETITEWRYASDPIQRVFISELDTTTDLVEYRPEEVVKLATTR
jgi:hypothetical protein